MVFPGKDVLRVYALQILLEKNKQNVIMSNHGVLKLMKRHRLGTFWKQLNISLINF